MHTSPLTDPYRHRRFPAELNEEFLTLRGERHYFWRAVHQEGNVSTSWSNTGAIRRRPSKSIGSYSRHRFLCLV